MQKPIKSNNKDNIMILGLSNYASPTISENPSRKWINYGDDNNYFEYLLDRYKGSATSHALINGISEMIVGEGLVCDDLEILSTIKKIFSFNDIKRWAFDLKWGGFYMQQIIRSKDLSKIVKVKHTPVQNWRSGKADSKGIVREYYYSDDWNKYTNPNYRPQRYSAYDSKVPMALSILAVKPYRAGSFYYPTVDYQGALQYAHIEEEISNFHINNLLNGMFPGLMVNFNNGIPDEDTRRDIEDKVNKKWGRTSNTGRIMVSFNDDKERSATIEPVAQTDLDKMFDLLSKESSEKIMIGNRVTSPALFGVKSGMGLGNNADELRVSAILFEQNVLKHYRYLMLENFKSILAVNGINSDIDIKSLNPFDKFPEYKETPNKMDINDGTNLSKHKHDDRPIMTDDMQNAYLDSINPYGEVVDEKEWFEVALDDVSDEEEEDKLYN